MSFSNEDLAFLPALKQARLIRDRAISPLELTELYLSRIDKYNPQLNCFYHVAADSAIADARQKTEYLAKSKSNSDLPPLFGVPTAIKDLTSVKGMPTTYGVGAIKDNFATYDDNITLKLKQAGTIILGKTATSQLGSLPYTEPEGFAPTRNPWNLNYTPGGSSGGAAAAVAAGLCSIAQGGDAGGSIRGPAFCCNLVGLKPSRGRVSYAPVGDRQNGIASSGMLVRTVADAAALLDTISGYVTGDPYWLPNPETSFLEMSERELPQLRIAYATEILPVGKAAAECQQSLDSTIQILAEMGHEIEPISIDLSELIEPFKRIWAAGVAAAGIPAEILSQINRWIMQQAGTAGEYLQAAGQMQAIARNIVSICDRYDALIVPTYMHPAIKVGEWAHLNSEETLEKIVSWILPCPPFNATGQPSINIPAGFDRNGVPLGVQLVGKPAAEETILALAAQIEAAKPWSHFCPTGFKVSV
ncbi:amidase [Myxosarcina sp. GI1]|uniref:amidase n=1 Tax=Myxosarcina sp. GI1 TaxID=1541065 RepID=UPI00055D292E|nr:amidase [Myxosarcina sp. GI1]